ncbi:MAG TPA: hypothetical protein VJH92_03410 [Candidatus Nanoarchaeia archaeon]|nr:hypothetical protein [Candidatus Nanoarchaeia archaeon]
MYKEIYGKDSEETPDFKSEEYEIEITKEAEDIVKETFPKLWSGVKEDMKEYSKKEVAERMYLFGILTYMRMVDIGDKEIMKEMEKDPEMKKMMDKMKKNLWKEEKA